MGYKTFIVMGIGATLLLSACIFRPLDFDEKKWRTQVENSPPDLLYAANFKDGEYYTPWLEPGNRSFLTFLRWRLSKTPHYSEAARNHLPDTVPGLASRIALLPSSTNFITWIGHATFLFRIDGRIWLTDPMLSERALLPKRRTPPALDAADIRNLPGPIRVLLSHNHYDHLDAETLSQLPADTIYYVPAGLGEYVSSLTSAVVHEMNWWETRELGGGVRVDCLPAQHWSRRIFQGYNSTLWASFMVTTPGVTIYFGGDSGYFKGYREIGNRFGTIDYALLPITAYEPRWFMHFAHMDTREAIRAFTELGADYFIPTQWGTFHLGDNPPGLPALELAQNVEEMRFDPERFLLLELGEIRLL